MSNTKTKESTMNILQEIQSELKAPKGQKNNFGNYAYRSAEDILTAVKPLLKKHGAALILTDALMALEGRIFVKSTACLHCVGGLLHAADGFAEHAETKKGMDQAQIAGSASSYARKYALNGLFAIDDTKDPDATNDHGSKLPKPTTKQTQGF
jgi:hypothetical protein